MSQHKYLVLFRSRSSGAPAAPSPEQMQQMFAAYRAWMETFKDALVDLGDKLKGDGRVVTADGVADGPFIEAKELIGGYMIVAAASYDEALKVVRACPAMKMPGAIMEVREMVGAKM